MALIILSTLLAYSAGMYIHLFKSERTKKLFLWGAIGGNLVILCVFKYFNFFILSLVGLLEWLNFPYHLSTLNIILPMGISFFTFQALSYPIDIYYNKLKPAKSFSDFALFVAFFPQLVAGPIMKAGYFIPQLDEKPRFEDVKFSACMSLFVIGLFKKMVVDDNIAVLIDPFYADPTLFASSASYAAVVLYSIQIYCDFSGYTDMAIAVAGMLGYRLIINFDFPYLAVNFQDFWRRWHISLSTWFRDYVYIPLGGRQKRKILTYCNLIITMGLCGLWHGAAWNFVLWGLLHGVALVIHRILKKHRKTLESLKSGPQFLSRAGTFIFVTLAWILFRAEKLGDVGIILKKLLFVTSDKNGSTFPNSVWMAVVGLGILHLISYRRKVLADWWERLPTYVQAVALGGLFYGCYLFSPFILKPFIYFQF